MATGWIRAYADEDTAMQALRAQGKTVLRSHRAEFRAGFMTELKDAAADSANRIKRFRWGTAVELPDGLSTMKWTRVKSGSHDGFVRSAHLVEIAYVKRKAGNKKKDFTAVLEIERKDPNSGVTHSDKRDLIWGDLVQITRPGSPRCEVRARGVKGKMKKSDLTADPLLEVYFVDVGQGDGILVRTPDGRHLMVDGGLERNKQQTGKNAADFVDWKFFFDYGDCDIKLEGMVATHSDNDHYGGLHDLVRTSEMAERELDCRGVAIGTLYHPGLSRWSNNKNASPPHKQGLGQFADGCFIQLLGDRNAAEIAVSKTAEEKLSGPWKWFFEDVLDNSSQTKVERVLLERDSLAGAGDLPVLWPSRAGCDVRVLGPVAKKVGGQSGLPDFGKKSYNTNGHSICLRLDYGKARILLTGDLNKTSMDWLAECYGDRMGAWECDVVKGCHHGSDDVSYRFLEKISAAATVICSGDAEGHAHPRPEIVAASAMTGFKQVDRENDRLVTPLVYMTEIERSVSLGALNRIDFRNLPVDNVEVDGAILGRHVDELNDKAFLTPEARRQLRNITDSDQAETFVEDIRTVERPKLKAMESDTQRGFIRVDFNLTVPQGPVSSKNVRKRAWRSRIMQKNHYGLVNVRTDGKTILCATLSETGQKWVLHTFTARFGNT